MTAHLRRLVARSRGTLPIVQPRLPARFESWSDDTLPPASEAMASAPTEQGGRNGVAIPASATVAPPPRAEPRQAEPRSKAVRRDDTPRAVPTPPEHAAPESLVVANVATPGVPVPSHDIPADATMAPQPAEPRAAHFRRAPGSPITAAVPGRARAAASPAAAERTETVVHVTIGRVDVRAVATPPAAPAPRPRAAAQGGDLATWLARRSQP